MAAVTHPRGSRSLSSHLQSRLGLTGVKAGLLRECAGEQALRDPALLGVRIKALPVPLQRARPIDRRSARRGQLRCADAGPDAACRGQARQRQRRVALVRLLAAAPSDTSSDSWRKIPRRYPYSSQAVQVGGAAQHDTSDCFRRGEKIGTVWDTPLRSTPFSSDGLEHFRRARRCRAAARHTWDPGVRQLHEASLPAACSCRMRCRSSIAASRTPAARLFLPQPVSTAVDAYVGHSCILMHCREMRDKGKRASARRGFGGGPAFVEWMANAQDVGFAVCWARFPSQERRTPNAQDVGFAVCWARFQAKKGELHEEQSLLVMLLSIAALSAGCTVTGREQDIRADEKDRGRRQEVGSLASVCSRGAGAAFGMPGMPDAAIAGRCWRARRLDGRGVARLCPAGHECGAGIIAGIRKSETGTMMRKSVWMVGAMLAASLGGCASTGVYEAETALHRNLHRRHEFAGRVPTRGRIRARLP